MDKKALTEMVFKMVKNHKITSEDGAKLIKGLRHDNSPSQGGEKPRNSYDKGGNKYSQYLPSTLTDLTDTANVNQFQDIAIIGMSGKFPDARNVNEYWNNLTAGRDSVREIPETRWDIDRFYDPDAGMPNKSYSKWGGFLSDTDRFDPAFFKISPKEAELMDPQQRLFLQEAWSALEDAGYPPQNLARKKCGVFVGCVTGDYQFILKENQVLSEAYSLLGNMASILAARISYALNLKGPSIAIDTACSSSLVTVHLACESIRSGTSELALAGGVMIYSTPQIYIWSSNAGLLSPEGKCKAFDSRADGMVLSEGVGVVVLKSLKAALKAGDHIIGIIKGSGINQDGKTDSGITVPSASAQTELESEVYSKYNIPPETISYVEAHGTGTKLGDPIEIEALTNAFRKYTHKQQYCAIGSVKTNIGHTQIAAGIAGLIKLLLCLKHKKLVPSLHLEKENEHINFKDSPFYVNTEFKEWKTEPGIARRAAISSFGVSGTNAHLVVEEYESPRSPSDFLSPLPQLIVLSAKNEARLKAYAKEIIDFLESAGQIPPSLSLTDFAYTLQVGREAMEERLAIVASSLEEYQYKLTQYAQGQTEIEDFYRGNVKTNKAHSEFLIEGEAGEAFLRIVIEKNELTKLAQLWVSGVDIDWQLLYPSHKPQRISLPTYPFARERYWIPTSEQNLKVVGVQGQVTKLHPLIESNTSTLGANTAAISAEVFLRTKEGGLATPAL
jgi:acyl transferase domain-containing protein